MSQILVPVELAVACYRNGATEIRDQTDRQTLDKMQVLPLDLKENGCNESGRTPPFQHLQLRFTWKGILIWYPYMVGVACGKSLVS